MAKQSGLGMACYVAGVDISGDVGAFSKISGSLSSTFDVTGIDKYAFERLGGSRDGGIDWSSFFNDTRAHPVLSALPTGDILISALVGTTLGAPAAQMVSKQTNYDPTRADSGELTIAVSAVSNGFGLEWGNMLTAGTRTDTAATNGASFDTAASAAFGAQAYLQVFGITGTDATVKLQDSADNSSFADITGMAFTQITAAPGWQRIASANTATIRRYVRAVTTTTGGFTSLAFAVGFTKNTVMGQVF